MQIQNEPCRALEQTWNIVLIFFFFFYAQNTLVLVLAQIF